MGGDGSDLVTTGLGSRGFLGIGVLNLGDFTAGGDGTEDDSELAIAARG